MPHDHRNAAWFHEQVSDPHIRQIPSDISAGKARNDQNAGRQVLDVQSQQGKTVQPGKAQVQDHRIESHRGEEQRCFRGIFGVIHFVLPLQSGQ